MSYKNALFLAPTFFIFCTINYTYCQDKHIVLHIDVNKTIIASDIAQGKDVHQTINGILSEYTKAKFDGNNWQSYYNFVTDKLLRENPGLSRSSEELKAMRSKELNNFPEYLKNNHGDLYNQYEADKQQLLQILMPSQTSKLTTDESKMALFPSFFKLINWLNKNCTSYSIHLRTFGEDLPVVVPLIHSQSNLKFAQIGKFQGETLMLGSNKIAKKQLYDLFKEKNKHYAIKEDFSYWKTMNFKAEGAKCCPIDLIDSNTVVMFFDDNAADTDRPIVNPISPDGSQLDVQQLIQLGVIVPVNPKEAILNENYFIDKVAARLQ